MADDSFEIMKNLADAVEKEAFFIWKSSLITVYANMVRRCPVETGFLRSTLYLREDEEPPGVEPKPQIDHERGDPPKFAPPPIPFVSEIEDASEYHLGAMAPYAPEMDIPGASAKAPNGYAEISINEFDHIVSEKAKASKYFQ